DRGPRRIGRTLRRTRMRPSRRFRPAMPGPLEDRVVLSRVHPAVAAPSGFTIRGTFSTTITESATAAPVETLTLRGGAAIGKVGRVMAVGQLSCAGSNTAPPASNTTGNLTIDDPSPRFNVGWAISLNGAQSNLAPSTPNATTLTAQITFETADSAQGMIGATGPATLTLKPQRVSSTGVSG